MKISTETIKQTLKEGPEEHVWKIRAILNGGPGSGNFGHAGIPGQRGGSAPGGSGGISEGAKAAWAGYDRIKAAKSKGYNPDAKGVGLDSDRGHMDLPRSDTENKALGYYKGFGYQTMNSINYGTNTGDNAMTREAKVHMEALDHVIDRNTIGAGESYSGLGERGSALFVNTAIGDSVTLKGYVSTTTDKKDAAFYTDKTKNKTVLVIRHKSGDKGFFMGNSNKEKELLLPRNKTYRITKRVKENGIDYIHLDKE